MQKHYKSTWNFVNEIILQTAANLNDAPKQL